MKIELLLTMALFSALQPAPLQLEGFLVREEENGLKVAAVEREGLAYITLKLYIKAGSYFDPPGKEGLSCITGRMLMRGTRSRTYTRLIEEVEQWGASLSVESTPDALVISGTVLTTNFASFMDVVSDILINPTFPDEELKKVKEQVLSEIASIHQDPRQLASYLYVRELYRDHPYNHLSPGLPESVKRITKEDVLDFYRKRIVPEGTVAAVVSGFSPEDVVKRIEEALREWRGRAVKEQVRWPEEFRQTLVVIYDRPDYVQAQIRFGNISVPMKQYRAPAFGFVNSLFGGSFTSRLMRRIRVEEGLTYGISSSFNPSMYGGDFTVSTFTEVERTGRLVEAFFEEVERIRKEGVRDQEVERTRNFLTGLYPISLESSSYLASKIATFLFYQLPLRDLTHYQIEVMKMEKRRVNELVRRYIPENYLVFVVGPADKIKPQLEQIRKISRIEVKNGGD